MSSEQSIRLFQMVNKHFKNEEESRLFVADIESIVEQKLENKASVLATKEDILKLEKATTEDIFALKQDISRLEIKLEAGFKDQLKWLIFLMLGFASLIITVVKLL